MFQTIPLNTIIESPLNPRRHFDPAQLEELAASIRQVGLIEPIVVRPLDIMRAIGISPEKAARNGAKYEIVAGARRFRGATLAKLTEVPVLVRELTDDQVLELMVIENGQRDDLDPIEEASGYRALITSNPAKYSAAFIAERIGRSEKYVWDRMKLLDLIPEARQHLEHGRITPGHAILIARLKSEDQKRVIAPHTANGYGAGSRSGLWQHQDGLDFEDRPAGEKPGTFDRLKAVTTRELEAWIADHIRFDLKHAVQAAPLDFGDTARRVEEAAAQPGRGKKVVPITYDYNSQSQAAHSDDERTYGFTAWKRADGQDKSKTCEHAILGVVVAGHGQGKAFPVCIARDKCEIHWADVVRAKKKATKLREQGQTAKATKVEKKAEESWEARQRRQDAERNVREKLWAAIATHVIAEAVRQVKSTKALTPKLAAAVLGAFNYSGFNEALLRKHLGSTWYKTPVAALLVTGVADFEYSGWQTKTSGFDQYLKDVAKPFGLDVKRLEAIRDQHAPKGERVQAPAVQKKGKAKAR